MGHLRECTSLHEMSIPHAIKAIKRSAFEECLGLTRVIQGKGGLAEIGVKAFCECTSLNK